MLNVLNEVTQYLQIPIPGVTGIDAGIVIAAAILGILYCFFGYRSSKLIAAILGFCVGFLIGMVVVDSFGLAQPLDLVVPLAAAVVLAILNFFLYKLGIFVDVFFVTGTVVSSLLLRYVALEDMISLIVGFATGLVFAILAVIFGKSVVIVITALMGGLLFSDQIFTYLVQVRWSAEFEALARLGVGLILGLIGLLVQFITTRRR